MEDEIITGNRCPRCGYPTVMEFGLEVCYYCGWFDGCNFEKEEIKDEELR